MAERVIEVVTGLVRGHKADGRCVYDAQAKRELVKRCQQPGVSVAATALAHGINANLLRTWITRLSGPIRDDSGAAAVLLPVRTRRERSTEVVASVPAVAVGHVEIVLGGGTIRLCGEVSARSLQLAIDCLSRRS